MKKLHFKKDQTFGLLSVIEQDNSKNGNCWKARCACGSEISLPAGELKHRKSCGCRGKSLVGKRYGRLFVTERTNSRSSDGRVVYSCLCDCGKKVEKPSNYLTSGDTKSCGCYRKDLVSKTSWKGVGDVSLDFFNNIRRGAEARDIVFDISLEYVSNLFRKQKSLCALSGMEISLSRNLKKEKPTASLDRIDSSLPYKEGNVWWVHKKVNIMKNKYSVEDFVKTCRMIVENRRIYE